MSLLPSIGVAPPVPVRPGEPADPHDDALDAVVRLVTAGPWFDFAGVRPAFLRRRVERRMAQHPAGSMSEYLTLLQRDLGELEALRTDLLASGSWFFRDPRAWEFIAQQILPAIIGRAGPSRPIRVWVPFCGAGAEAYTLAMLILEQAGAAGHDVPVQLFASDVDERSLELARAGRFPWVTSVVGDARLERFFVAARHAHRVSTKLRNLVVFARHDLFTDLPFSHMDLICCRYVFMHLRPTARVTGTRRLAEALDDGGYLVLAPVEHLDDAAGSFEAVSKQCSVYRRLARQGRTPITRTPGSNITRADEAMPSMTRRAPAPPDTIDDEAGRFAELLRLVTMGNLAASLAHDLSQPVAAIANLLEACAIRVRRGATKAELLDLLRQASSQSDRAGSLIAHVARLLHSGERRVERCELRDPVMTGIELLRPTLRRHDIELRVALGRLPLHGDVCRIEIEQVVVNLLQNAVDAILANPGGRRRIRVEASPTPDGHTTVIVADSGSGIRADAGDRIFEPFFTTKPDGLGMGLAICRSIVAAHGGRLWTERTTEATLLYFTLPFTQHQRSAASGT
jgi:chemotaxis methyl-accepting protein methylase/two-component sensor histidine kinase